MCEKEITQTLKKKKKDMLVKNFLFNLSRKQSQYNKKVSLFFSNQIKIAHRSSSQEEFLYKIAISFLSYSYCCHLQWSFEQAFS